MQAYGWEVIVVKNGDSDLAAIDAAIEQAKKTTNKPTFDSIRVHYWLRFLNQGTSGVQCPPLKADDIAQIKEKFGFNPKRKLCCSSRSL